MLRRKNVAWTVGRSAVTGDVRLLAKEGTCADWDGFFC